MVTQVIPKSKTKQEPIAMPTLTKLPDSVKRVVAVLLVLTFVTIQAPSLGIYDNVTDKVVAKSSDVSFTPETMTMERNTNSSGITISKVNASTNTFKDDLAYTQQVAVAEQTTPTNDDIDPTKFLFVHVGKAGGTTIFQNIRALCLIKNIERNIFRLHMNQTMMHLSCIKQLNHQAINFNPSNEMKISTNDMVIGSLHMNQKSWWWNADDDEESKNPRNSADRIRWVLSFGKENAWNETALYYAKYYEGKDHGLADSTTFLIPVRDPIDRIVSAFNYQHPENTNKSDCNDLREKHEHSQKLKSPTIRYWLEYSFFCTCFSTADDLADVFVAAEGVKKGGNKTMRFVPNHHSWVKERISCLEVAEMTLRGKSSYKEGKPSDGGSTKEQLEEDYSVDRMLLDFKTGARKELPALGHISINYGFYYRRTLAKYPSKKVVAIRTEHMFEDLQNLERQLGGGARIEGTSTGHLTRSYGSTDFKVSTKVSDPKRLQALCCAIASEAAIYIELIQRASNLSGAQKKESLEAFSERCDLSVCAVTTS